MRKEYHMGYVFVFLTMLCVPFGHAQGAMFVEYPDPVLSPGMGFDSRYISNPQVIKVGDEYWAYYGGASSNAIQVGLATSIDGIHWSKSSQSPVFKCGENTLMNCTEGGVWSSYRVVPEAVLYENGLFKMWYLGNNTNLNAISKLGYATSPDGIHWTTYTSNPVFPDVDVAGIQFLGVVHKGDTYFLYYRSTDEATFAWVATSTDGIRWSEHTSNPTIPRAIDSVHLLDNRIIARDWGYFGESSDGIHFVFNTDSSSYPDNSQQTSMVYDAGVVHAWYINGNSSMSAMYYATASQYVLPTTTNINTPPTITLLGESPLTLTLGVEGVYGEPGFTASDAEDGDLSAQVVVDASGVNMHATGTYTVQYTVTDSGGLSTSTTRMVIVEAPAKGVSNVAFLPGIMASRLYTDENGKENKRWESVWSSDIETLTMDQYGVSLRTGLYTKDIVDKIRAVTGWWSNGEAYDEWIKYMDKLVKDGTVKEWKALPYDWRLATDELFLKGNDMGGGKVSYAGGTPPQSSPTVREGDNEGTPSQPSPTTGEGALPYILAELARLADTSPTGKVTIVAHSNGGLVAKNLIRYLETTHHPLLAKIDTLVLVASPQEGTPKAVRELLHGVDMPGQEAVRKAVQYMPGAYGLLPSRSLLGSLLEPVVEVDNSVKDLPLLSDLAGKNITTYDALRDFLTGVTGKRSSEQIVGYLHPNRLNGVLIDKSQKMHDDVDGWRPPQSITFVQVVGDGLWTPRGVRYSKGETSTGLGRSIPSLKTEWLAGEEGDGTVLTCSAESGVADTTYYVDLPKYNKITGEDRAHGTMLSVAVVQQLIGNLLTKDGTVPPYIHKQTTTIDFPTTYPMFDFRTFSPVDPHLYAGGKHTGVLNEAPTDLGRYYEEEVPNSHYEEWADVKYLVGMIDPDTRVEVRGTGEGYASYTLTRTHTSGMDGTYTWTHIPVLSTSKGTVELAGQVPILVYDYNGDGKVDARIAPGENFEPWQMYDASFAGLRKAIRDAKMPKLLELWFLARVDLAEGLKKKGGKANVAAAKVLLETVAWSAEHQNEKALSASESLTIAGLARGVAKSLIPQR